MSRFFAFLLMCAAFTQAAACPFCRESVMQGQSVFETEHYKVLLDYEPRVEGHLLLVSKRHVAKAHELTRDEWTELCDLVSKTASVFSTFLHTEDYVIIEKNGKKAFQDVAHVHFHLLPIQGQTWSQVFDCVPDRLDPDVLMREVERFQGYFKQM